MSTATMPAKSMDDIVALCKRRGFIFPASEIYGGINGFWDFGPLGVALKNNLREAWWREMVLCPPQGPDGEALEIVGLDSAIIQNPRVWEASGHVAGFSDPMQTCRQCKKLFRADLVPEMLAESEWVRSLLAILGAAGLDDELTLDSGAARTWAATRGRRLAPGLALVRVPGMSVSRPSAGDEVDPPLRMRAFEILRTLATAPGASAALVTPCPACGGDLTEPRLFNLMFETHAGAVKDESARVYLRPETAQGVFINYRNVLDTMRVKVPFGIAQIGKAFRNEVTPRNFIYRSREFEQMEMEWFCAPEDARRWFEFWQDRRLSWWRSLGLCPANLRVRPHGAEELSHYARGGAGTVDIEYRFPFTDPDFAELEGIAHRTDFDLSAHERFSGVRMEYFDPQRNLRYLPHVVEPAAGLTRGVLAIICDAYTPDPGRPSGVYLRFHPALAPIQAGVFPLVAKDGMPETARKIYEEVRGRYTCQIDVKQSIGKRYARMDEAGTPFCFTVDGQTAADQTVTVRDRDTALQERIGIGRVVEYLAGRIGAPA
jgi:glycyl-tRNA synthetase